MYCIQILLFGIYLKNLFVFKIKDIKSFSKEIALNKNDSKILFMLTFYYLFFNPAVTHLIKSF